MPASNMVDTLCTLALGVDSAIIPFLNFTFIFLFIFVIDKMLKYYVFLQEEEELTCGVCQKEYSCAASLKAHLSKKHKLAVGPCFTCHLCGAIGQTKATLKRHLLRTHGQSSLMEHQMLRKVSWILCYFWRWIILFFICIGAGYF